MTNRAGGRIPEDWCPRRSCPFASVDRITDQLPGSLLELRGETGAAYAGIPQLEGGAAMLLGQHHAQALLDQGLQRGLVLARMALRFSEERLW